MSLKAPAPVVQLQLRTSSTSITMIESFAISPASFHRRFILPQGHRTCKNQTCTRPSSRDVHAARVPRSALWVIYGVIIGSWPVILTNIGMVVLNGSIAIAKVRSASACRHWLADLRAESRACHCSARPRSAVPRLAPATLQIAHLSVITRLLSSMSTGTSRPSPLPRNNQSVTGIVATIAGITHRSFRPRPGRCGCPRRNRPVTKRRSANLRLERQRLAA